MTAAQRKTAVAILRHLRMLLAESELREHLDVGDARDALQACEGLLSSLLGD
jgi:hypothetical protein